MNKFYIAFEARVNVARAKNSSLSNIKKLENMRDDFKSDEFVALCESSNVDAERFMRAIYASEKVVKFAKLAVQFDASKINKNTYAIFRTALNCARHEVALTKAMCEQAISKDLKVEDAHKHLVYQRNEVQDAATIAAQSQTSIDALLTLNILTQRHDLKSAYTVNLNALALAIAEKMQLETKLVSVEAAEKEAAEIAALAEAEASANAAKQKKSK